MSVVDRSTLGIISILKYIANRLRSNGYLMSKSVTQLCTSIIMSQFLNFRKTVSVNKSNSLPSISTSTKARRSCFFNIFSKKFASAWPKMRKSPTFPFCNQDSAIIFCPSVLVSKQITFFHFTITSIVCF